VPLYPTRFRGSFNETYEGELRGQLATHSQDPPTVLLLLVLIILCKARGLAVHASGKFVSTIIEHFKEDASRGKPKIPPEVLDSLSNAEKLVISMIKSKSPNKDQESVTDMNSHIEVLKKFVE
jgi:hypothetical protein